MNRWDHPISSDQLRLVYTQQQHLRRYGLALELNRIILRTVRTSVRSDSWSPIKPAAQQTESGDAVTSGAETEAGATPVPSAPDVWALHASAMTQLCDENEAHTKRLASLYETLTAAAAIVSRHLPALNPRPFHQR